MVAESKEFKVGDKVVIGKNKINVPEGTIYTVEEPQHFNGVWIIDSPNIVQVGYAERKYIEGWADFTLYEEEAPKQQEAEHTGGSVNYYKVHVANPTTLPEAYDAEANDIIESLGLTFAEGNLFKAIWRMAADRNGKKKKGNNSVYDAEKLVFFAERVLVQEKAKQ